MMFLNWERYVIVLLIVGGLYGAHRWVVHDAVKSATLQVEQRYKTAADSAKAQAKEASRLLQMSKDKDTQAKDETITRIRTSLANANRLLQRRPSRPATTNNTLPAPSCTGRELYREDGLFLRGEASRAEEVVVERDYYYNQYLNIQKELNGQQQKGN